MESILVPLLISTTLYVLAYRIFGDFKSSHSACSGKTIRHFKWLFIHCKAHNKINVVSFVMQLSAILVSAIGLLFVGTYAVLSVLNNSPNWYNDAFFASFLKLFPTAIFILIIIFLIVVALVVVWKRRYDR